MLHYAGMSASLRPAALVALIFLRIAAGAQVNLDDVHVTSLSTTPPVASIVSSTQLVAGTYLHVIKRDVNLVLIPVSVTDAMQRLVTGLQQDNFQVFEGRKPQAIKHFSREDAPMSVGIIVDSSGSMKDKVE